MTTIEEQKKEMAMNGWIAVDLDGTLAEYTGWNGVNNIGKPIPIMVKRVKKWLKEGKDVRIFTARVCCEQGGYNISQIKTFIESWCLQHLGAVLPITNVKDFSMIELWDDRCVQVVHNTGRRVGKAKATNFH